MPITLNNSNISVTYNTGSNYIIENVKSDLYVRGTTSGNLSPEPTVSPTLTTNIATFTHSEGTENQTHHTIYFPENTVCDILMIGGGGSGGTAISGGGGAGACIVAIGQTFTPGIYTIRVGKGGLGGIFSSSSVVQRTSTDGSDSSIFNQQGNEIFRAVGGGRGGGLESPDTETEYIGKTGGCGGGAGFWQGNSGRSGGSASTLNIVNGVSNRGPSVTSTYGVYGNSGGSMQQWTNGNYSTANAGGGGGIGAAGASGVASTNRSGVGGNGLNAVTINSVTYNFSNHFANGGVFGVNGYIGGGGGGGSYSNSPAKISGGLGGGGTGDCAPNKTTFSDAPTNGAANTGSGGGGACGNAGANGGDGGSGIVIIKVISPTTNKYLFFNYLPAQPTLNYTLTFPIRTIANFNNSGDKVMSGQYTVSVRTTQSTITPTQGQNLQDRLYFTSNLGIRYHTLNPIKTTEGAQWTYSSTNPNVYHLGSVGIGTTSPEYSLDVRGNIFTSVGGYTQTGTENWIIQSDRRIKENIVKASYEKCLENVKKIELYNFNFKDNYVNTNDRNQLGFIAQEVQEIYPKAVIVKPDEKIEDLLRINTTQIKYTLYGAVRSLIEKVERIEERVDKLYKLAIPDVEIKEITSKITEIFESTSNIILPAQNIP
jgi:hypothetical protein